MGRDVQISQIPDGGFAESPTSGLILPTELALKRTRWLGDVVKKMNRFQQEMTQHAVSVVLICNKCQNALGFEQNPVNGEVTASCKCERRVLGD